MQYMNASFLPWILLVASIIVLAIVPKLYSLISRVSGKTGHLATILNWSLVAVIVGHILPEVIDHAGYIAVLVAIVGFLSALALDYFGGKINAGKFIPVLVLIALALHGVLDGLAIKESGAGLVNGIGEVVVFHRLFAGLFIWQVCTENYSNKVGWIILGLLGLGTFVGFFSGPQVIELLEASHSVAFLEAFMAGGLLHVAFHRNLLGRYKPVKKLPIEKSP